MGFWMFKRGKNGMKKTKKWIIYDKLNESQSKYYEKMKA